MAKVTKPHSKKQKYTANVCLRSLQYLVALKRVSAKALMTAEHVRCGICNKLLAFMIEDGCDLGLHTSAIINGYDMVNGKPRIMLFDEIPEDTMADVMERLQIDHPLADGQVVTGTLPSKVEEIDEDGDLIEVTPPPKKKNKTD